MIPSDISDSAWGSRSRQNSARHIGFVMMVTVQGGFCDGYPWGQTPSTVAARQKKTVRASWVYRAAVCPLQGGAGKPQGVCRELSKTASGKRGLFFLPREDPKPCPSALQLFIPAQGTGNLHLSQRMGQCGRKQMFLTRGEHYGDIPTSFAVFHLVGLLGNRTKCFFILRLR